MISAHLAMVRVVNTEMLNEYSFKSVKIIVLCRGKAVPNLRMFVGTYCLQVQTERYTRTPTRLHVFIP
jgi:hypothetical protein